MSETLPIDPYRDVVLNHVHFDWSNPTLDAYDITDKLCGFEHPWARDDGNLSYWFDEEFKGMSPLDVESKILFDAGRPNWKGVSKFGKEYYRHMLTLIKLMFPETHITPSLADAVMFFCIGFGGGNKKILNLIGSLSSGKSAAAIRIAFACMKIDPAYCAVYVASPFDSSADSTVYGDLEELWDQLVTHYPNPKNPDNTILFPQGRKYANKAIDFIPNIPKAGRMELRNVKHVGKFKGTKSRGGDVNRGIIIVIIDEVNEIENLSFLTTLTNIASQDAFFCITSQNFKSEDDFGGQLAEPVGTYGGPSTYEELDIDKDAFWNSKASSVTLRFDGLRSPNILAGRDIYPKLFRQKDLDRIRNDYGEASPDYASQVRSFPQQGDEINTFLSKAKISASRYDVDDYTVLQILGSFSFSDPAFGGRDKAKWICGDLVVAKVTDIEGNTSEQKLFVFKTHIHTLKLVKDAVVNEYWIERFKLSGINIRNFTLGALISFEDQIAIQCFELNKKYGVPANHFGFDHSMRPDCVSSMNKIIGFQCIAFDYNSGPHGVHLQNINQKSEDTCKDRVTELAMLAADYFLTKQIRGGRYIKTAVDQLRQTRYITKNKKYEAEKKKDFKARFGGVSPDDRDCLMGVLGVCSLRGFRQNIISSGPQSKPIWELLQDKGVGVARRGIRI